MNGDPFYGKLEKQINIRASDYRFVDKIKYYKGHENAHKQIKDGTKILELLTLADTKVDFTEADIIQRYDAIVNGFLDHLACIGLLK